MVVVYPMDPHSQLLIGYLSHITGSLVWVSLIYSKFTLIFREAVYPMDPLAAFEELWFGVGQESGFLQSWLGHQVSLLQGSEI